MKFDYKICEHVFVLRIKNTMAVFNATYNIKID